MLWNEPNNLSHWDFNLDRGWERFARMIASTVPAIRACDPALPVVLGGISPVDPNFVKLLASQGLCDLVDVIAIHGFPLDWNHWNIHEWPAKIDEIRAVTSLPIWVTETGASSFGADEVQVFGLQTTAHYLLDKVERVHWYSLLDLPPQWSATTRHKESEGSAYYRHYYMGLIRADGTPKPAAFQFPAGLGICQWFHFEDHRLDFAVEWLRRLGVTKLRTGLSWADWFRPNAEAWFDRQMRALADFDVTLTLCFTPDHLGVQPHYTSPPARVEDFADFARWAVGRYGARHDFQRGAQSPAVAQPTTPAFADDLPPAGTEERLASPQLTAQR
jgi:beta-xylosidase